jgi:hypothetical protein
MVSHDRVINKSQQIEPKNCQNLWQQALVAHQQNRLTNAIDLYQQKYHLPLFDTDTWVRDFETALEDWQCDFSSQQDANPNISIYDYS